MRIRTTSTQRTYRYVRLMLIAATVLLAAAIGILIVGGTVPPSLSAAYYTPAGPVFVGALSAIALALFALSGRSVEQGLLDVAAVLALVVAYVPTTVTSAACVEAARCVPPEVRPAAWNNAAAVGCVLLLGAVVAGVLTRVQRTAGVGTLVTMSVIVAGVLGGAAWALLAPESFLLLAHDVAAVGFFLVIAAVASIAAWRPQRRGRLRKGVRYAYIAVAVGILLTLVLLVAGITTGVGFPVVLVGESVALVLFTVFWVVQTVELWNEPDPALRA